MVLQQHIGIYQQVVKVHSIRLFTTLTIPYIYILQRRTLMLCIIRRPGTLRISLWKQQVILCHRDTVGYRGRLIYFIVQLHLLDNALHQRTRITLVINREVRLEIQCGSLRSQYPCENRMEGTHLKITGTLRPYQSADTLLHLPCCLIGKCQREDIPGIHPLLQ